MFLQHLVPYRKNPLFEFTIVVVGNNEVTNPIYCFFTKFCTRQWKIPKIWWFHTFYKVFFNASCCCYYTVNLKKRVKHKPSWKRKGNEKELKQSWTNWKLKTETSQKGLLKTSKKPTILFARRNLIVSLTPLEIIFEVNPRNIVQLLSGRSPGSKGLTFTPSSGSGIGSSFFFI